MCKHLLEVKLTTPMREKFLYMEHWFVTGSLFLVIYCVGLCLFTENVLPPVCNVVM
jgi:hypothetical protein